MGIKEYYEDCMRSALEQARIAGSEGEVPVGAAIFRAGRLIAIGRNKREGGKSALAHAEIEAIDGACRSLGGWRLEGCELFVTLEPCPMCAGAAVNARIKTVVYGASDPKAGSCGSLINLFECGYNHRPAIVTGVLNDECAALLSDFFAELRAKRTKHTQL